MKYAVANIVDSVVMEWFSLCFCFSLVFTFIFDDKQFSSRSFSRCLYSITIFEIPLYKTSKITYGIIQFPINIKLDHSLAGLYVQLELFFVEFAFVILSLFSQRYWTQWHRIHPHKKDKSQHFPSCYKVFIFQYEMSCHKTICCDQ